jgi:hypothetical protein
VSNDDWRVEITLDDERHGYDLGERLRARDLDDEVRERLGERVYVSRNGPQLFIYAQTEEQAREAESVLRSLVAEDDLSADFLGVTRWHPAEQEWKNASIPLPSTQVGVGQELERREHAERAEADEEGSYDWLVKINVPSAADAERVAESARAAGHPVHRIWRWVTVDALTEESANELVESLRGELPADSEIWSKGPRRPGRPSSSSTRGCTSR